MSHYFVTNIQKHGNACVINLHSWYTQESVILELTDGGKGNVIIVLVNTINQLSKIWQQIQTRKQVMKPEFINYELRITNYELVLLVVSQKVTPKEPASQEGS